MQFGNPYEDPAFSFLQEPIPPEEYGVLSNERMQRYLPMSGVEKFILDLIAPQATNYLEGKPIRGENVLADLINLGTIPVMGGKKLAEGGIKTVAEEIPSLVAASYRGRKALRESGLYPEVSQAIEDMGGVTKNLKDMIGQKVGGIKDEIEKWFTGMPGVAEEMLAPALPGKVDPNAPFIYKMLGKHGVVPVTPASLEEPLIVKTPEETVVNLWNSMFPKAPRDDTPLGLYYSLWNKSPSSLLGPKDINYVMNKTSREFKAGRLPDQTSQSRMAGDLILSSMPRQEDVLPHEGGHLLRRIIKGNDPRSREVVSTAREKVGVPLNENFEEAQQGLWNSLTSEIQDIFRRNWKGLTDKELSEEVLAELTRPGGTLSKRLERVQHPSGQRYVTPDEAHTLAWTLRTKAEDKFPVLDRFWQSVPEYIPESAYWLPKDFLSGQRAAAAQQAAPDIVEMLRGQ